MHNGEHLTSLVDIFSSKSLLNAMTSASPWRGTLADEAIDEVFSWSALNDILFLQRIGNDRLRMSLHNDFASANKKVFSRTKDSLGRPVDQINLEKLHEELTAGATAVLEAINESSHFLNFITESIYHHFTARSTINAYFSFGSESGFGPHNDDHDVIILQLYGRKSWTFFDDGDSVYGSAFTLQKPTRDNKANSIIIERGDMLYLPKGIWHDVAAMGEPSLHITIGLLYPSLAEFFIWLLESQKYKEPYTDIRPFDYRAEKYADACFGFARDQCNASKINEFLAHYHSKVRRYKIRPDLLTRTNVDGNDELLRVPSILISSRRDAETNLTMVQTLGKSFYLSDDELKILDCFDKGRGLTLEELTARSSHPCTEVLVILSRLLDAGMLTKSMRPCDARRQHHRCWP
jgi:ribosomal protein L16 Arg81 hydroxylase